MRTRVDLVISTAAAESADLTRVPPAAEIVDSLGHRWRRGAVANGNYVVMWDETSLGWQVHALKYVAKVVWFSDSGGWHTTFYSGGRPRVGEQGQSWEPGTEPPPPPPPPENRAPVWASPLIVAFTDGEAKRVPARQFVSDADGDALTLRVVTPIGALAAARGFSYDEDTDEIVYDGTPTGVLPEAVLELEAELTLEADDGRT